MPIMEGDVVFVVQQYTGDQVDAHAMTCFARCLTNFIDLHDRMLLHTESCRRL